eukprot:GDKJ01064117.1.p1 GENE.GDKJ01064117.1~~GDKJ01064117.1.p1  ORF type:complete len:328 (-),score=65.78 GDKJ01064117.1:87-1070(-)
MAPKSKPAGKGDEPDPYEMFLKNVKKVATEYDKVSEVNKFLKPFKSLVEEAQSPADVNAWNVVEDVDPLVYRCVCIALRLSGYMYFNALRIWKAKGGDSLVESLCHYLNQVDPAYPPVREIQLVDIAMTHASCDFLSRTINASGNPNIMYLRLDYNMLGDRGAELLASAFGQNKSIRKLSLQHCEIEKKGAVAIAQSLLSVQSQIKDVNLRGNPIGTEGVTEFLRACRGTRVLKKLDLSDTGFHGNYPLFINTLLELLKLNNILSEYWLLDNSFPDDAANKVAEILEQVDHVQAFVISERIKPETLERLTAACGKKKKKAKKKKKQA